MMMMRLLVLRTRRVINSLVSGTFRIGKSEDLKIIQNLIVKTGSSLARSSVVSSDVWFEVESVDRVVQFWARIDREP
jgi:hypothetical protein